MADTVTVLITESPSSSAQDLDFCVTDADTPVEDPSYKNGAGQHPAVGDDHLLLQGGSGAHGQWQF